MIEKQKTINGKKLWNVEFRSIHEFEEFITKQPFNAAFSKHEKASIYNSKSFTETESFEEAIKLLHSGWQDKAKELTQKFKAVERDMAPVLKQQQVVGVAGYQPIVPLFLSGQPACMVGSKMQPVKQKVVTVVKSISYPGRVRSDQWTEQGLKALAIVKKLEQNGYRVNVDIIDGGTDYSKVGFSCRVRVKNASERLNVSKLAFTLCNPSIERRLMFRFEEVYEHITSGFVGCYGKVLKAADVKQIIDSKREVMIPAWVNGDINKVKKLEDVERLGNWI